MRTFISSALYRSAGAAVAAAFLLGGCASLPVGPFQTFQKSVEKAQSGLEAEVERDADWTREAEVQETAERKDAVLSGYMVRPAAGTGWTMDTPPAYWNVKRTRRALEDLNGAFLGYAALLSAAASGQLPDEAAFDALSGGLNQGLRDLSASLGGNKKDDRGVAGAASFVSESLRRFAQRGRARDLRAAVRENQPAVDGYAAACLQLVGLIRADLKASYADQLESIQRRWDDKRSPGRATLTRSLFNLNDEYAGAMEALQQSSDAFTTLPAAHQELAVPSGKQSALASLAGSAARVARSTRQLEKSK